MKCAVELESSPSRFTRQPGDEPIKDYRLLEPLGVGGFGEVWKCLVPGGLLKAIKIVTLPPLLDNTAITPAAHERAAMDRIKEIRHPFLISVDRVDASADELYVVMELADSNLLDEFERNRSEGRPGIPEQQLLHYLLEAAEVLDLLNLQHGLQHLDVKPANLLVVNRHVKLADFGLVSSIGDQSADGRRSMSCGVTPRYASPEMLQGSASRSSDQYSLAIVYQELLTGELPFQGNGLLKRLLKAPNLEALPETDRPVITRALSVKPEDRFPSCVEFIHALLAAKVDEQTDHYTRYINRCSRANPSISQNQFILATATAVEYESDETLTHHAAGRDFAPVSRSIKNSFERSPAETHPKIHMTENTVRKNTHLFEEPSRSGLFHASSADAVYPPIVRVSELEGKQHPVGPLSIPLDSFIAQLVTSKTGRADLQTNSQIPQYRELGGDVVEHSFPMEAIAPLRLKQKLEMVVKDCRGDTLVQSAKFITFVVEGAVPFWNCFTSKQRILKTTIKIETPCQEQVEFFKVTVRIEPLNPEGPGLAPSLIDVRSLLLRNIRTALQVVPERRMHERWPCNFGVKLYPVLADGQLEAVIDARAGDLSAQGIGLIMHAQPTSNRVYLRANAPKVLSEFAILTEIVRHKVLPDGSYALGAVLGGL